MLLPGNPPNRVARLTLAWLDDEGLQQIVKSQREDELVTAQGKDAELSSGIAGGSGPFRPHNRSELGLGASPGEASGGWIRPAFLGARPP